LGGYPAWVHAVPPHDGEDGNGVGVPPPCRRVRRPLEEWVELESLERCFDAYLETARSLGREGLSIRG